VTQQTSDSIDVGIRVAREFGFPCFVLCVVGWWVHAAAIAIHSSVVVPVIESHSQFLTATSETLKSLGETQEQQAKALHDLAEGQREIQQVIRRWATGDTGGSP